MSLDRGELRCLAVSAAAPCSEYQRRQIRRRQSRHQSAVGWLLAIILAALCVPVAPAAAEPEPVRTTEVTFVGGGGVILHGIVVAPRRSRGTSTSFGHAGGSGEPRPARAPTGRGGVRPARRHHAHLRQTDGRLQPVAARLRLARRRRSRGGGTVGDPRRRRPISPRIVGPIGRSLRRPARLPSVECGQVRDHSRRGRGDSSGADRLGLRPVPPPRGRSRRAARTPWRSPRFGR